MPEITATITPADRHTVMRFRAITGADPRALARIVERVRAYDLTPKTVRSYPLGCHFIEIRIETDPAPSESFWRLIDEIDQMPMVIAAVPFDFDWVHPPARA